jgi:hypothetical protein
MIVTPASRYPLDPVVIHPYTDQAAVLNQMSVTAPASAVWSSSSSALLVPIRLIQPFTVAKAYWCNGATVGTDSIDIGVYQMTDMTTGRCDLIRSTGAVLSAGTVSVVQEASAWKVARTNLTASFSDSDATSYTTASVTLKAGRLYLMAVQNAKGSAADAVTSITGGTETWTSRVTTQYNASSVNRISIWSAVPATDYTGTIVISFGANTQTACIWSLTEMSGVDTSTTDGVVQSATGTGNSVTPLATLAAFASANNATFGAMSSINSGAHTVGSGFTQLSTTASATPAARMSTEWRVDNDTTADATVTSSQWGAVAVEVKADASSFIIPPSPPGSNPNVYMAFVVNGGTATVFRRTPAIGFNAASAHLVSASSFPLPSTLTPATLAASALSLPLAGFSSRSLIG